jgi:hypothetical protein
VELKLLLVCGIMCLWFRSERWYVMLLSFVDEVIMRSVSIVVVCSVRCKVVIVRQCFMNVFILSKYNKCGIFRLFRSLPYLAVWIISIV